MNKPWKLIVLLVGIFLAGGVTGTLVTMRIFRQTVGANRQPPSAELWTTLHLKRIANEVGLQPGQLEQIKPIISRRMAEQFQMRSQFLDNNHAARELMEREVAEKLTPEQRLKYDALNREFHERSRRLERGERGPERGRDR